jgi:Flp pilus assembly protein TadG
MHSPSDNNAPKTPNKENKSQRTMRTYQKVYGERTSNHADISPNQGSTFSSKSRVSGSRRPFPKPVGRATVADEQDEARQQTRTDGYIIGKGDAP